MVQPWLSILMPTYNGARYLPETLASLQEQDLRGVELLVVDDGSSDDTLSMVERFGLRCSLQIVDGPRRKNWVASTNVALARARGEFACMLHQDDGFLPNRLVKLRALTGAQPKAALWTHWARYIDDASRTLGEWRPPFRRADPIPSAEALGRLLVQNFYAIASPVFRVRDAQQLGGLDEDLWYTADWDFWLKLSALGATVCLPEALAWFRVHSASQTVQRSHDPSAFREQLETVLERHLPALNAPARTRDAVARASRLSLEVNVALSSRLHGNRVELARLGNQLRHSNLEALLRFARDTRLHERIGSRLRARIHV